MNINVNELHDLKSQQYNPNKIHLNPSHDEEFLRKEFSDGDIAEIYHENTKVAPSLNRMDNRSVTKFVENLSHQYAQARLQPKYRGRPRLDLPEPDEMERVDLRSVLSQRRTRRSFTGRSISLQKLSTLLGFGCGKTGTKALDEFDDEQLSFRTYPSAGGLYPVEVYPVVIRGGPELDSGLYHYVSESHSLRRLRDGREGFTDRVRDLFLQNQTIDIENSALLLLLTGAFWRSKAKYGPRGYRFVLQESGHLLQNVLLSAEAIGLGVHPIGGGDEPAQNDFLEIDGVDEAVIYAALIGETEANDE